MKRFMLAIFLVACSQQRAVDEIKASSEKQAVAIQALETRIARLETTAKVAAPVAATADVVFEFVRRVRADPTAISRASGLKLGEIIDESGMVTDAHRIAAATRDKTIRIYGKETARKALVDYFGAEIGSAVFYDRIKNP